MSPYFYYTLAVLNLIALAAFGLDKLKAARSKHRIPESTLLVLALLAGSPGALMGMILFNHKTSKAKFRFGIPLILALQATAYWYFLL
ncbi:MAG: DUF1294 domain-containing protein [Symploca sp. SIO2D2]|nr:DUF1294 domain-containing protein [Symploca sp. SIO2D2]